MDLKTIKFCVTRCKRILLQDYRDFFTTEYIKDSSANLTNLATTHLHGQEYLTREGRGKQTRVSCGGQAGSRLTS